ncbi:hypothetical protein FQA39_LY03366 [Lamprigera yunnana]|nr:hypothetical protein FQA39_LY03366 [Lamprigera yunnana]
MNSKQIFDFTKKGTAQIYKILFNLDSEEGGVDSEEEMQLLLLLERTLQIYKNDRFDSSLSLFQLPDLTVEENDPHIANENDLHIANENDPQVSNEVQLVVVNALPKLFEEEWIQFHEKRENINKYFQTFDTIWKPRQIGSKTLTFEMTEEKKFLKIEDMSGNEVYLGWESVSEVWSLESVLRYRLSYSSGSNFKYFYEDVIRAVAEMSGDVKINIYNIINRLSEKSDDVCCMLEVLLFMPEKALFNVQLERRIPEQEIQFIKKMWMLYAQEHWTKAFDLKSAVERLYEELGALEFDAEHEAIYRMERYYTVQQCEELRDKYKIGRKCLITNTVIQSHLRINQMEEIFDHMIQKNIFQTIHFCFEIRELMASSLLEMIEVPALMAINKAEEVIGLGLKQRHQC